MVVSLYGYDASRLLRDDAWVERYCWAARHGAVFVALCDSMRDFVVDRRVPADAVVVVRSDSICRAGSLLPIRSRRPRASCLSVGSLR